MPSHRDITKAKWQVQQQETMLTACEIRIMEFEDKIEQEKVNIAAHTKAIKEAQDVYNKLLEKE